MGASGTADDGDQHIYHREIDPNGSDSLALISKRISPGAEVLDVGTGSGALGRFLSSRAGSVVDGVNYSPREVEMGKAYYRDLLLADLEVRTLGELFPGRKYDVIVFADVLEHLRAPQRVLADALTMLRDDGKILISLPNVGYMGVVAGLIAGEFEYTDEGLLDRTHLRFFTRKSLLEMLATVGLTAVAIDAVAQPLAKSEFARFRPDALPPGLTRALLSNPDSLTYQFVVEARLGSVDKLTPQSPLPTPELTFVAQLFWASPGQHYAEAQSESCVGKIGELGQRLRFPLPPGQTVHALRFDPADRPGVMTIHGVRWCDRDGHPKWEASTAQAKPIGNTFAVMRDAGAGLFVTMLDDDPGMTWAVPEMLVGDGDFIECIVDWPTSPDALAAREQFAMWLRERETALTRQCADLSARLSEAAEQALHVQAVANSQIEMLRTAHAAELHMLNGIIVRMDAVLRRHASQLETLTKREDEFRALAARREAQLVKLEKGMAALQKETGVLRNHFNGTTNALQKLGLAAIVRRDLRRLRQASRRRFGKLWHD